MHIQENVLTRCKCNTISKALKMSILGWWIVHTIVLLVLIHNVSHSSHHNCSSPWTKTWSWFINTIKDELHVTFVSLGIIVYPVIYMADRFKISGEVHLQVCYKANVTWVLNYVLECNAPKNITFLTHVEVSTRVYLQTWDISLP
jgi:hypothetical protein